MVDDGSLESNSKLLVKALCTKKAEYNSSYHSIEAHRNMNSDDQPDAPKQSVTKKFDIISRATYNNL